MSYRQLDYWERTGIIASTVPPLGSGSRAAMSTEDVVGAAIIATLIIPHGTGPGLYRLPGWDAILEAVENGGIYAFDPRTGAFGRPPLDADYSLVVDIDRIAERVTEALAAMTPKASAPSGGRRRQDRLRY